jgi:hypothetical protein
MGTINLFGIEVGDLCSRFPDWPGTPEHPNSLSYKHQPFAINGISVHHDGEVMAPGDTNYNGSTADEDLRRLVAIYEWNYPRLGGFPYQLVASPNGRLFLCRPIETWGAHTGGHNNHLLGIAMMGDYSNSEPPVAQLCAGSLGLIIFWRWREGLLRAAGHCDWPDQFTECPGTRRSVWIDKMLKYAAANVQAGR